MNTSGSFGSWLKQRRKALDLTQIELANQVGCAVTTIQKIEANIRRPSKQIAARLADLLALSPDERAGFLTFARRVAENSPESPVDLKNLQSTSHLPVQPTPFLGRENEMAQIASRLKDPNCRLVTLVGVGGIGKTRLAVQAAADWLDDFTDGVYFVSLTPIGSTTLITAAIASALQISFYGQDDPNIQLMNYLRTKHVLLIIDNYEHLLGGVELLAILLAAAPRLKILATSRERLNLQEEWVLPVEGLPFPIPSTKAEVGSYSAVQLFVQTAKRLEPGFLLEANQEAVTDICQAVEGMPLGIELAATWLRAMPCQQIAEQIRRDLGFLETPLRNIPERHRSMRAVFDHSWNLLSDAERNVLMKLSVFRGGIDPDAALEVADALISMLAGLVDKSLARLNAAGRFELHELLRQYAADKLEKADKTAETKQYHFQYFLRLAEQFEKCFFGSQHLFWMDRIEIEHDNFRAALDWTLQAGEAEDGLRMASTLGWFWNRRAYWREGYEWLEKLFAVGANAPIEVRAKTVHHLLELSKELEGLTRESAIFLEALTLVPVLEDSWIRAWLFNSLAFAGMNRDVPHLIYLEEALALFTKLNDQWGICETLLRLSGKLSNRGDLDRANELLEDGIRRARQAGDKSVLSWMLVKLGDRNWLHGRLDTQTEHIYQESLMLFRELRCKNGIQIVLSILGEIAHFRGDDEQAKTLFEQSLRLGQQIGVTGCQVTITLIKLAEIFSRGGVAERGVCLLGAMSKPIQVQFVELGEYEKIIKMDFERARAAAHVQLDEAQFATAFAEGQTMTPEQAVAYALANTPVTEPVSIIE